MKLSQEPPSKLGELLESIGLRTSEFAPALAEDLEPPEPTWSQHLGLSVDALSEEVPPGGNIWREVLP